MLIFGLYSTSNDQLSNLSDESWPKCKERPPKSSKNEMLIFGLHSTPDNWLSDLGNESWLKCKKRPPSHQKMKFSFLDYIQLYQSTCRATPLPCSQNETASMVPNLKPPSLPKMKLPIGCPIWNPFKHEYYRFLSIHVSSNLPKIGRQCTPLPKEWTSWIQVKVTFWFWLTFGSGWHTSLEWKSWIQVKVTF